MRRRRDITRLPHNTHIKAKAYVSMQLSSSQLQIKIVPIHCEQQKLLSVDAKGAV